ncbi:hypothetical protein ACMZ7R_00510, partial [Gardnerella vaginalis]
MMNKKAIAAFAAGATLLAGFAMATPAMALDFNFQFNDNDGTFSAPKAVTEEEYREAQLNLVKGKKTLEEKKKALEEASKAYNNATSEEQKKSAVKGDGQPDESTVAGKRLKAQQDCAAQEKLNEGYQATIDAYEHKSTTPVTPDPKQPEEVTPSTKAGFIGLVSSDKVALDEATANKADKMKTYSEKYAALSAADAALSAATANFKAAHQRVVDAKAAGEDVSNPTAYNDLVDAEKRAQAELDAA